MSFTWTFWLLKISVKRLHTLVCFLCFESFSFHLEISLFGEIVVNYPFGKTLNSIDLVNLMSSVSVRFNSFLFLYSIFNERKSPPIGVWLTTYRCTSPIFGRPLAGWSVWMDSNHRPHAYQACALTTWATNRYSLAQLVSVLPSCLSLLSLCEEWIVKSEEVNLLRFAVKIWWRWWGSNPWPPACRAGALPAELYPRLYRVYRSSKIEQQVLNLSYSTFPIIPFRFAYLRYLITLYPILFQGFTSISFNLLR